MKNENESKVKIITEEDVKLACDGDLNGTWEKSGGFFDSVRQRISIRAALIAPSRPLDVGDTPKISNN